MIKVQNDLNGRYGLAALAFASFASRFHAYSTFIAFSGIFALILWMRAESLRVCIAGRPPSKRTVKKTFWCMLKNTPIFIFGLAALYSVACGYLP
jgi:hypothetical protein